MRCPDCGSQLGVDYYCCQCEKYIDYSEVDFEDSDSDDWDFEEPDYDSMVDNGEEICLNCTYWTVDPHGSAYGMYCLKGNGDTDPDDTCYEFVQSHSHANFGDEGQYQFNTTRRDTKNKLGYWKSSR